MLSQPRCFIRSLCLTAAILLGLVMSAAVQAFTFQKIADNSGVFETFALPDLNDHGQVVFPADVAGVRGLYVVSPGEAPQLVIDTTGVFDEFDIFPRINNAGTIVSWGTTDDERQVIFTGAAGGPVETIAETNGDFAALNSGPSISDDGTVAFAGRMDPDATGITGVYTRRLPDPFATVEDDSGPFETFFIPFINHQADISFFAREDDGASAGVYNHQADGTRTLIIDNTGEFSRLLPYSAPTSDGRVAVRGVRPDGTQAIVVGDGDMLVVLAETGDEFQDLLSDLAINDNGLVVFNPRLADSGLLGLYFSNGATTRRVIGPGDPLFGSTVRDVFFGHGLNERNGVAFLYVLENDEIGIAVTTIPEPGTWGLLAVGGVALLLGRRAAAGARSSEEVCRGVVHR